MKILFICGDQHANYLRETIFHGLVSLGHEVIDVDAMWFMYSDISNEQKQSLYGKGMTIFGTLPKRNIDRTNIADRILDREFDLIIYGRAGDNSFKNEVQAAYKKNKVVLLAGGDAQKTSDDFCQLKDFGTLFIRELAIEDKNAFPIQYSIPKEKILNGIPFIKTNTIAPLIPGKKSTYIYNDEESYYEQYRSSFFALTMKKGGYDCLRHYEIIANGCLPLFKKFNELPTYTMFAWPRKLQYQANYLYKNRYNMHLNDYCQLCGEFMEYVKNNLTTELMATYMLEKMQ